MKAINTIALILVIIGAINWGLWGFFQFDFVAWLLGGHSTTGSRIAYGVIGLAGLWSIGFFRHCCKKSCSTDSSSSGCCK